MKAYLHFFNLPKTKRSVSIIEYSINIYIRKTQQSLSGQTWSF
jgi:hypothetical protein